MFLRFFRYGYAYWINNRAGDHPLWSQPILHLFPGPSRRLAAGAPPPSPYQTSPHLLILTGTIHAAVAAAGEPFVFLYPPRTPAGAAASAPSRGVSGLALHLTSRGLALGMVGRFPDYGWLCGEGVTNNLWVQKVFRIHIQSLILQNTSRTTQ
ncbi:hypothetical protein GQ55_8G262700 [Panicum hallii var. hallii]|uniref:Uncharacterized protein n=1 Tax=Panicum hallii var. hallii TaxID=1504633 RepID=A0A2T7CRL7_9POAL|nr:hypothetical protein GQ55_8G262700 [Panicum hallii var. hallii]